VNDNPFKKIKDSNNELRSLNIEFRKNSDNNTTFFEEVRNLRESIKKYTEDAKIGYKEISEEEQASNCYHIKWSAFTVERGYEFSIFFEAMSHYIDGENENDLRVGYFKSIDRYNFDKLGESRFKFGITKDNSLCWYLKKDVIKIDKSISSSKLINQCVDEFIGKLESDREKSGK